MTLSNNYDWIVLGDHPGALVSANLVAKLGLSVLILPKCGGLKAFFSRDGQCLDPEPNFVIGIGSSEGLVHQLLNRVAGISLDADLLPGAVSLPQALTPERRFLLSSSRELAERELDRELPVGEERELIERAISLAPEVQSYWTRLPSKLTVDISGDPSRKKQKREAPIQWEDLVRKLQPRQKTKSRSDLMKALGQGVLSHVSEDWSLGEWVHSLALGQSGASIRGGMTAYRKLLLRSAKRLGATVLEDAECRRIFVENRRFVGIQVSVSANMISGTGCILGTSIEEFRDRLSFTGTRWQKLRQAKPSGWRFTLGLTVRDEALMPGVSRRMVWKESGAPEVEMEIAEPSEYGTKEADHKLIFLRTILPFTQESLAPEYQRTVSARMFRLATEIIPFLEFHVTRVFPDFRSDSKSESIYSFQSVSEIPENLRVPEVGEKSAATGLEGFFTASCESFSNLGSFGPVIAALEATAWVAHRLGLPGPVAN